MIGTTPLTNGFYPTSVVWLAWRLFWNGLRAVVPDVFWLV